MAASAGRPLAPEDIRVDPEPDLSALFHRLNNQLSIILANAELLESRAADDVGRARASQVVTSVLEAMGTVRELRLALDRDPGRGAGPGHP